MIAAFSSFPEINFLLKYTVDLFLLAKHEYK